LLVVQVVVGIGRPEQVEQEILQLQSHLKVIMVVLLVSIQVVAVVVLLR
tara:strand:+ start:69 stop:215 length:147 start_codon:yes stop_codon:yes gene_type:complete